MRFESTIDINASPQKVWALVDRLEDWPQWMPSIKKIEKVSRGPLAVGSQLSVTTKVTGLNIALLMTVTQFIPERSVVLEGKALAARLTRFYNLEPVDDRTKVTIGGEVSGALAWLVRRGGQAISAEIGRAAKKKIEESE